MSETRSSFTGKIGFVLAAAGSAVGLGNIWRFPYLAAKYGGGIFLLVYLILSVTFGFTLMVAEIAIGRKTGKSAIHAFSAFGKKYNFIGVLASIVPMIILPYYCVIGGWVTKYLAVFATGNMANSTADSYFGDFIAGIGEPIGWFALYLGLTALVVLMGVEKGIEKVSKIMMPVLIVLLIFISVYSMTRPGVMDGVLYYITPDFSKFSVNTVLGAMGQLFYSMSLAMGIMITYGSYMKKDVHIESSVHQIEVFDTGVAFLAGLMVVPAVFAFSGGNAENMNSGPGLMFETLPRVFAEMGNAGHVIGGLFFLLVLFAALTSSISLMETVVSIFCDKFRWSRKRSLLVVLLVCVVLGLPSTLGNGLWSNIKLLGMNFLDFFDFISNSVLMPVVALITAIFVGYVIEPQVVIKEVEETATFKWKRMFILMIRYVVPVFIVAILISSVLNTLGVMPI